MATRTIGGSAATVRPKRVALFGLFGIGNHGNDASIEAMVAFIRRVRPDCEIFCICQGLEIVSRSLGIPTVAIHPEASRSPVIRKLNHLLKGLPANIWNLRRTIGYLRKTDALIIPGTGILDDFGLRPFGLPFKMLIWCVSARLCGTKIAFVSIGAGPIHNPITRCFMKWAARLASYLSYRDTVSRTFMHSIGIGSDDGIFPDLVFGLPIPQPLPSRRSDAGLTVGLGVMEYYGWTDDRTNGKTIYRCYMEKLCQLATRLVQEGYRIRLLGGYDGDNRVAADLLAMIKAQNSILPSDQIIVEPIYSVHDVMRQIAETDVVVATRYHNVICAVKLCVPVVAVGYSEKFDVLMQDVGLGAYCQHVERLDIDILANQVSDLVGKAGPVRERLRNKNREYEERLKEQGERILARLM